MSEPYYADGSVTLWHGDCREIDAWESARVLITDPPYGISWKISDYNGGHRHDGIQGDRSTAARDYVLGQWGSVKPGLVFGSSLLPQPHGTKQTLVWRKPVDAGFMGAIGGWRRDWEAVYMVGNWPAVPASRSAVIETPGGMANYLSGHPHAKPLALMEALIATVPGGLIADPFAGGGSTLVAAKRMGRRIVACEVEERYCELAARRLSQGVLDFGDSA